MLNEAQERFKVNQSSTSKDRSNKKSDLTAKKINAQAERIKGVLINPKTVQCLKDHGSILDSIVYVDAAA